MDMKRRLALGAAIVALTGLMVGAAEAKKPPKVRAIPLPVADRVDISVDKVSQHMRVSVGGIERYDWLVSTGGATYDTPSGNYHIFRMEKEHFSVEWDNAPMPYSMFFTGIGHAIHGSYHVKALGTRASHGCVRLAPENAAVLWGLITKAGFKNNTVTIKGGFFEGGPKLTTEETFHMTPKEHGTAFASLASVPDSHAPLFWWQKSKVTSKDVKAKKVADSVKPLAKGKRKKKEKTFSLFGGQEG